VFGSVIVFATPPLRGPDEIAHFLRIHSYARGEVLPPAQIDGRKGIFIQHELNSQLQFFRSAGEWFAGARDDGVRYWQIMAVYQDAIDTNGADHPAVFAPFAGTEGYNPVAYIPYIAAGVVGGLFGLNFPDMLLFMRLLGLATFTALAAYAIAVSPVLKWAFVLIALLPVSLYNRSVLSADGAALSTAMIITAVCLRAVWQPAAGRVPQPGNTWIAVGIMGAVIAAATLGLLPIVLAAVAGAVLMVLTGVLTPGSAGRALDWNVLFVLAGSVGLGAIVVSSGLADLIAEGVRLASGGSELLFVIAFAAITTVMTNVITNAAAASIMTPVGIAIAREYGIDPTLVLALIGTCISFTFLNPFGHQTNMMVMRPGGYTTATFLRFGTPVLLAALVTAAVVAYLLIRTSVLG
jgi:hypothetical protein